MVASIGAANVVVVYELDLKFCPKTSPNNWCTQTFAGSDLLWHGFVASPFILQPPCSNEPPELKSTTGPTSQRNVGQTDRTFAGV